MRYRVNEAQFDREREQLERDLTRGIISQQEYRTEMWNLDRAEREAFREAAEANADEAYRETMGW